MSGVVSDSLDALIDTMRAENHLPAYLDDVAVISRMQELLGSGQTFTDDESVDENAPMAPADTTQQFEDAVEAIASSVTQDHIAISDVDVGSLESTTEATVAVTFSDLEQRYPGDELLKSCKGQSIRELAIVEVYSNIPVEMYSSEMAKRLLLVTAELLERAQGANVGDTHTTPNEETAT